MSISLTKPAVGSTGWGTAVNQNWTDIENAINGLTAATQAEMEAASSTSVYATPGRTQYHPGVAKAWCDYTTITTTAINASYNISSLTDNGTGDTTFNFSTSFSSANYCAVANGAYTSPSSYLSVPNNGTPKAAGSFRQRIFTITGSPVDAASFIAFFGDQ